MLLDIKGWPLYYPCSGQDLKDPIEMFVPYVKDFWFVDLGYFTQTPADKVAPVLTSNHQFRLDDIDVRGAVVGEIQNRVDARTGKSYRWIEPCVRTEKYRYLPSNDEIRIHRRRGFGPSGLRREIDTLGVFFYRGDSREGGSGTLWLTVHSKNTPLILVVLDKLVNKGLIVTDGSNCYYKSSRTVYLEFARFHGKEIGAEAVQLARPFEDEHGNRFDCVGYAGHRYGPTLIWQVSKPSD